MADGSETWHGKLNGYTNHRCRCEACTAAMREYGRQHRGSKATPERRSQAARIGALARWAKHDPQAHVQRMMTGRMDKFRREVLEADPTVVEPELTHRAECALRAHMKVLAAKSAKARSEKAAGKK